MPPHDTPPPGAITLDHSGHFIADVDAARAALESLGFTVTPYSAQVQPDPDTGEERLTGTGNICVMLPEGYLEFLVHTADTPIGEEFMAALNRRSGVHLAAFGATDAAARHAALMQGGHPMRPLVSFSRPIDTEEGTQTAAFTVARVAAGAMPEGRVQIVTHHTPAALWQSRWTGHANGAQALSSMLVSCPDPTEAADRFVALLGGTPEPKGAGLRLALDRGALEFLPEQAARDLVGAAVEPGRPCFVGLRLRVADLAPFRDRPGARTRDGAVVLPFGHALGPGVWLFEAP